ncbi:MAG: PAS domain S-box protein, partial [Desulfobacula sp.]|nr:PAS domain S-box protein [Desulfobacula sp.]
IPEWEWTIGAGVYLDTIENTILQNKTALYNKLKTKSIQSLIVMGLLLGLIYFWAKSIGHQMQQSINTFASSLTKANIHSISIEPDEVELKEFKDIALLTNEMLEAKKQAERILERHKKNLQLIFDSSPNILALVNEDARIEMINHKGAVFSGKKKEDLLGFFGGDVFNCINSFDGKGCGQNYDCSQCPVRTRIMSTLETGESTVDQEGQMTFLINDKETTMDLLISTIPLRFEKADKVLLSVTDITEYKQKEAHYKQTIESSIDGFWIVDKQGRIIAVNNAYCQMIGYSQNELLNMSIADVEALKTPEEIKAKIQEIMKNGSGRFETRHECKSGSIIEIEVSSTYEQSGKGIFFAFLRNITERKLGAIKRKTLETQLQQAQRMESIGTLAGGIAHDFNNILFPVMGYTEMLLEDIPEENPVRESLEQIYNGTMRAKELVQQILTFARQQDGELKLMQMQPMIKEAIKLIRSTIPTTINIQQNIQTDCRPIKADPTQIHQIVMNLATNAYHAMEEKGGELKIILNEIEFGEHDLLGPEMTSGVYACLTVADTGKGMDRDLKLKIFDPFFTTKGKNKGTGMGLSVVHGIVRNMGGAIKVYSEPGIGTEFKLYLPVVESISRQHTAVIEEPILIGTEQILLVDDEIAIIKMEQNLLERLGYHVISRSSSIDALEAFRANPDKYDLVITDMQMPNMPGDKLSVELKKIRPDIPILLCTGFSETMSEEQAASLGINGFLLKPIIKKDLSHKIREVLD